MKKLFIFFAVVAFASCKKSSMKDCYRCYISNGVTGEQRTLDTCSSTPSSQFHFTDANGNDMNHYCEKK